MSIIVLTPKPPQAKVAGTNTVAQTEGSLAARVGEDFLHLLGHEGYRFDSFEQLRDFAQAQLDAATLAEKMDAPAEPVAAAPAVAVEPAAPVPAPAAEGSHDAAAAVTGSTEATPDSIIVLTPPPPQ